MAAKKSKVNAAGNYTKPTMRKNLVAKVKAGSKGGKPGHGKHVETCIIERIYQSGSFNHLGRIQKVF